jgi:hypothetical protein
VQEDAISHRYMEAQTMSNYNQFIKDLKQADYVYGYVVLTKHDGQYLQLTKTDVRKFVREEDEIQYHVLDNSVYIN